MQQINRGVKWASTAQVSIEQPPILQQHEMTAWSACFCLPQAFVDRKIIPKNTNKSTEWSIAVRMGPPHFFSHGVSTIWKGNVAPAPGLGDLWITVMKHLLKKHDPPSSRHISFRFSTSIAYSKYPLPHVEGTNTKPDCIQFVLGCLVATIHPTTCFKPTEMLCLTKRHPPKKDIWRYLKG